MEELQHASSRKDVRPPNQRPSAASPDRLGAPTASLRGHQQFQGQVFILVIFWLEDSKGDQVLSAVPESQKLNRWSLTLVEVMMAILYRSPHFPNDLFVAFKKDHISLLPRPGLRPKT